MIILKCMLLTVAVMFTAYVIPQIASAYRSFVERRRFTISLGPLIISVLCWYLFASL